MPAVLAFDIGLVVLATDFTLAVGCLLLVFSVIELLVASIDVV